MSRPEPHHAATTASTPAGPARPGRRAVTRGVAWSVPALAVGAAAPALAASGCSGVPAFASPAWTLTTTGTTVGGSGGNQFVGGVFESTADAANLSTVTATATTTLSVTAGVTYTVTMTFRAYLPNARDMNTSILVNGAALSPSPLVDTGSLTANSGQSYVGSRTGSYVATTSGTVTLAVRTTVSSPLLGSTTGDDMFISPLVVSCT